VYLERLKQAMGGRNESSILGNKQILGDAVPKGDLTHDMNRDKDYPKTDDLEMSTMFLKQKALTTDGETYSADTGMKRESDGRLCARKQLN